MKNWLEALCVTECALNEPLFAQEKSILYTTLISQFSKLITAIKVNDSGFGVRVYVLGAPQPKLFQEIEGLCGASLSKLEVTFCRILAVHISVGVWEIKINLHSTRNEPEPNIGQVWMESASRLSILTWTWLCLCIRAEVKVNTAWCLDSLQCLLSAWCLAWLSSPFYFRSFI